MNMFKFKKYWQVIQSWHDRDVNKFSINPARVWIVLICLFFIGLLVVFAGLFFLKQQLSTRETSVTANTGATIEKLDDQKLKLILIDHLNRVGEFEKLELEKPNVIDPGV